MHEHFWKENMKYEELKIVDLFHSQYDFVDWKEIAVFIMSNKKKSSYQYLSIYIICI